jgi:hypothetical protein
MQIPSDQGKHLAQRIVNRLYPTLNTISSSQGNEKLSPVLDQIFFAQLRTEFYDENQHRSGDDLNTYVKALQNHLKGIISSISQSLESGSYKLPEAKQEAEEDLKIAKGKSEKLEQMLQKHKGLQS